MNYGLDLNKEKKEQDGTEYLAGVLPECKASGFDRLSFEEQKKYFPEGEVQRSSKDDMQDCASRDKNNLIEAKMNWLIANGELDTKQFNFLNKYGYLNKQGKFESSDAFVAINSSTTRQGNSLKAPLQAIHKYGLIPKKMLPLEDWMTWEDYHNPKRITKKMYQIGEMFLDVIGEILYGKQYDFNQKRSLVTGLYAWPSPKNGIYPRVKYPLNHAVWLPTSDEPEKYKWAFDNYIDSFDGDFIKKLVPDYRLYDYGYEIVIGEPRKSDSPNWLLDIFKSIWQFIKDILWK